MYIVEINNNDKITRIHDEGVKLKTGKIVKGINTIDTFTFSMMPDNSGFYLINEFLTRVTVYNTAKDRYEFIGRVLYAETSMDEEGKIQKTVTCESVLGYLCDSYQLYKDVQNWSVSGLLEELIGRHNYYVEDYKEFKVGNVTDELDSNDNLYEGIQRENTWDSIKSNLIDKIGGELQVRIEDDGMFLDYLTQIGEEKSTEIAMSVNMKAITREQDPTGFVTKLIPYGCKLTEEYGEDTEIRLTISSLCDGAISITNEEAIEAYGIHCGIVIWDDVTDAQNLYDKAVAWLEENNRVQVRYSINALDLSLIGLAVDDFQVGNIHPVKNPLLGIDDKARIIKKTIDICEETKSTIEIGDSLKTLSDIQREQAARLKSATQSVQKVEQTSLDLAELTKKVRKLENDFTDFEETVSGLENDVKDLLGYFDNEWTELEVGLGFAVYGGLEANKPMYKVSGDTVEVKGCIVPTEEITSSTEKVVFASGLPEELFPSSVRSFICQGEGMNRWLMTVETDGKLTISRYGVAECVAVPTTEGLYFNGTYMIEQKGTDET